MKFPRVRWKEGEAGQEAGQEARREKKGRGRSRDQEEGRGKTNAANKREISTDRKINKSIKQIGKERRKKEFPGSQCSPILGSMIRLANEFLMDYCQFFCF